MARRDDHVFYVTINVPIGNHLYLFKENNNTKNDPKKPTAPNPQTGQICNKLVVESLGPDQPTLAPGANLSAQEV